jgi:HK97 gp10 family phage protein
MSVTFTSHKKQVNESVKNAILVGLEACGAVAETYAKKAAPVDTGRLRNSIAHKVDKEEPAAYIGTNVEYAPYQEFGTRRGVKAKHFLRNAAQNHSEEYKTILENALRELK